MEINFTKGVKKNEKSTYAEAIENHQRGISSFQEFRPSVLSSSSGKQENSFITNLKAISKL